MIDKMVEYRHKHQIKGAVEMEQQAAISALGGIGCNILGMAAFFFAVGTWNVGALTASILLILFGIAWRVDMRYWDMTAALKRKL